MEIKILRCKICGIVLTEKWTKKKAEKVWYCNECANRLLELETKNPFIAKSLAKHLFYEEDQNV